MRPRAHAVAFHDFEPERDDFRASVLAGLAQPRKALSPKFFYDAAGSALFERICELPEYYPTRTELSILHAHAADIAALAGADPVAIEFGSGGNRKIRALLEGVERLGAYIAIDISKDFLLQTASALAGSAPGLEVVAVCADYTRPFALPTPRSRPLGRRLGLFLGSSLGNFQPLPALRFLVNAAATLGRGAGFLVGVDLKKDPAVLEAAYNDSQGVTAAFNLNLLARINAELDGGFELSAFRHRAHYDAERGRIEMHLESLREQSVAVAGRRFGFARGETIHTENSYKFSLAGFRELAQNAGFVPEACWTDERAFFSLHYLRVP